MYEVGKLVVEPSVVVLDGQRLAVTLVVDPEENPDAVGECLRSVFFDEEKGKHKGCYSTFDWAPGVEPLEPVMVDQEDWLGEDEDLKWTRGRKDGFECRYFWDGDGTLAFRLPNGQWLVNSDCKKSYGWELKASEQDL